MTGSCEDGQSCTVVENVGSCEDNNSMQGSWYQTSNSNYYTYPDNHYLFTFPYAGAAEPTVYGWITYRDNEYQYSRYFSKFDFEFHEGFVSTSKYTLLCDDDSSNEVEQNCNERSLIFYEVPADFQLSEETYYLSNDLSDVPESFKLLAVFPAGWRDSALPEDQFFAGLGIASPLANSARNQRPQMTREERQEFLAQFEQN